ncbi:regulatory protein RecX [Oerskovia enterophila]|uniref:Regulatory protein RecX n=1 Tax=Oerskovia enterophila TaxID=43678 RepID=A0ABX2Y4Q0_9CELL|nr:regulatory protein RecX [Oerskovia enterophila]OCI31548.1 regulatory protein RecX [Oerskovia enterophila]
MPEWARPLPGEEGDAPIGASGTAGDVSGAAGGTTDRRGPVARSGSAPSRGKPTRGVSGFGSSGLGGGRSSGKSSSFGSSGFGERSASRGASTTRRRDYSGERKERKPRPTIADRVESGALAGAELTEHAREAILRTLTAAPKSRRQLMDSMTRKGYPSEVLEPILDRFEEVGLVDDAEYAGMIVRTRHGERGLSRRAIAQELRRKGIDDETATGALDQVDDDDEHDAARELVQRRLARTTGLDREVRTRRVVGMLARKGYSPGLALTLVREELAREGEEADDEPYGGFDDL